MELYGLSLTQHLDNIFAEVGASNSVYGFPLKKMYRPNPDLDLSVRFHGKPAATPLGPASGPHTQMVQNILLSFLGGCRIMELKTVQILDELEIPRPCIDARTVGYNVEWSQEMKLADSYHEYVTAWVVLKILEEEELLGYAKGDPFYQTIFDMSVGYDLKGISSEPVTNWIREMKDAGSYIQKLLDELPDRYGRFKQLAIDPVVSTTLTLSTFHGCPRDEIYSIVTYLIGELDLDVYVKMNPTQLGFDRVKELLNTTMGYTHIQLDGKAFEEDLQFDEGVAMMQKLVAFAKERGRSTGAKFTNTLVVRNTDNFFKDEVMYLSGTPLHVLSMNAMYQFRAAMGSDFPVSFSAGIDQNNFTDAVCCDMKPVTTCTDLLQKGGYTRAVKYLTSLERAMKKAETASLDAFIQSRVDGQHESTPAAGLAFAAQHVPSLEDQPRYHHAKNSTPPKKVDSHLETFDCLTCNICLPVCPNAANFSLPVGKREITFSAVTVGDGQFEAGDAQQLSLEKPAQIANLADFCNECANCEVFCPELGGPQIAKPRFFNTAASFDEAQGHEGFYFKDGATMVGRLGGQVMTLVRDQNADEWHFQHPETGTAIFNHDNALVGGSPNTDAAQGTSVDVDAFITMKTLWEGVDASDDYAATQIKASS